MICPPPITTMPPRFPLPTDTARCIAGCSRAPIRPPLPDAAGLPISIPTAGKHGFGVGARSHERGPQLRPCRLSQILPQGWFVSLRSQHIQFVALRPGHRPEPVDPGKLGANPPGARPLPRRDRSRTARDRSALPAAAVCRCGNKSSKPSPLPAFNGAAGDGGFLPAAPAKRNPPAHGFGRGRRGPARDRSSSNPCA